MNFIRIKAYSKVNLTLDVIGIREDGYHNISSVMQTVSLYDNIEISKKESGIKLSSNLKFVPCDSRNTAYKAAELFFKNYGGGADIKIKKRIPVGGGLGGSSADAAGVLLGLNELFGCNLSHDSLCDLGSQIGADVPFLLTGGTALCEGLGDIITPLADIPKCYFVITKPRFSVNTKVAYSNLDKKDDLIHMGDNRILTCVSSSDLKGISNSLFNVFEQVTDGILPIKEKMVSHGALNAAMTGSGSAVFGVFENKKIAEKAMNIFKRLGLPAFLVSPISKIF